MTRLQVEPTEEQLLTDPSEVQALGRGRQP
jgi:hypothetical protein